MNTDQIRTEELLLLKLCRLAFSEGIKKEITGLTGKVNDWKYFCELANEHGLPALVYSNLKMLGLHGSLPRDAAEFLHGTLMRSLARNVFINEMMAEILEVLNKAGIKTVLLKGVALENILYGNAGLRQMNDADILVSRTRCMEAWKMITGKGFRPLSMKSWFHRFIMEYQGKHLPTLVRNGGAVEIHHELFGNPELTDEFFNSCYRTEIKGKEAWTASPQLCFIYLIRHLWSHEVDNSSQIRLYTDLALLIGKYNTGILNNSLFEYARKAGIDHVICRYLINLRDWLGVDIPPGINSVIEARKPDDHDAIFLAFLRNPRRPPEVSRAPAYRFILGHIPGFHRKALYLLGDIFPSISFMKKRYGCSSLKAFLYYPHRLGKLLWLLRK